MIESTWRHASSGIVPRVDVGPRNAGIVDQNVDAAEKFQRRVARALDIRIIGDIDGDRLNAAALGQFRRGLLGQFKVAVPDRDGGAGIEKPFDDGAANALRAAGHGREFACEIDLVGHAGYSPT